MVQKTRQDEKNNEAWRFCSEELRFFDCGCFESLYITAHIIFPYKCVHTSLTTRFLDYLISIHQPLVHLVQ